MNINSLLPQNAQANQNAAAIALERKWEKTGLLEGMSNEVERKGMAVLLENQAKQLVSEANVTNTAGSGEEWSGVALPLVRRIFAEIAAKDFVSVQPMNLPSGLIFYLDFKYATKQGTDGNEGGNDFLTGKARTSQDDSVFGVTDATKGNVNTATEGLYGAGRFGYTINDVSSSIETLASKATGKIATGSWSTANTFTDNTDLTQVGFNIFTNFNSEFSASVVADGSNPHIVAVGKDVIPGYDVNGVRAFNIDGTGVDAVYPEFTRASGDYVYFLVDGDDDLQSLKVIYHKQPGVTSRGDFEDIAGNKVPNQASPSSTALDIPEIDLQMRSEAIVAKTRKLKAVWSPEFAQDLNAYHSIDAEAELTSMLSEYVSQEIDLEILDMLIQNAQTVERWSARVGQSFDAASNSFVNSNADAQAYNQGTWFQTLGTKVQKVSNKIHQLTLRGGANFLVCSPSVATILESIPGYAADTDGDKMQFAMGVQKVGAINNRFQVYKNPYMTENAILMGYRGSQFLETGAVYSPYIPLIMTPLVYDPENFTPRKGVMTRYAKKMVRPEFYGKIYVEGLDTV
jgi:hypothetical protein